MSTCLLGRVITHDCWGYLNDECMRELSAVRRTGSVTRWVELFQFAPAILHRGHVEISFDTGACGPVVEGSRFSQQKILYPDVSFRIFIDLTRASDRRMSKSEELSADAERQI
jgi:hypothetical protein